MVAKQGRVAGLARGTQQPLGLLVRRRGGRQPDLLERHVDMQGLVPGPPPTPELPGTEPPDQPIPPTDHPSRLRFLRHCLPDPSQP
ncbi:hypothetical protein [Streptomyces sp. BPTC-684]|uniref:hypothetical protein n=1 Tax=Streptomyces sp. BPTC-684 TaxID=3043734 RepID=UPI0024B15A24|nr:hypothetical protein [Streptomyces sp. BPTC-684]WHM41556.1 hypothetical protein QIY60_30850 [Streptomyces sp. BPTC-684]